jgi:predicted dehydrogenase/threonine dehydrogenase-like Zn-dependent dehydrogenase
MKQVAQNYRTGELAVLDVPSPACRPGGVLVRTLYSLISTGTEMMKVGEARLSLLGKARARPDQVKKVLDTVTQLGPTAAYQKVMNRLDSFTPLGYSLCGVVECVGEGATEFHEGQIVACAGNEHALHAEVNWVPTNLCVPVPDGLDPRCAAFATVGAIAMQGVRRAEVALGDTACVIGLGLVGQLVVQLLVAAGARVVGLDVVEDRCRLAEASGAVTCVAPSPDGLDAIERAISELTGGLGADQILLVAGGSSNEPVRVAARLARDRARIVDIGKCDLDLPWNEYYEKELDVRFSRSYGPGRYDPTYEMDGVDYPAGYVRWTERRNLACFLDLASRGVVDVGPLTSEVFPVDEAVDVYGRLNTGTLGGVAFLFAYPAQVVRKDRLVPVAVHAPPPTIRVGRALRLGFIGAGNYASSMLLPHLARLDTVELAHVATRSSLSAVNAKRKFAFTHASTDADAVLADKTIDAVFITTRHSSHAALTCQALEAGKAVFVEKPLALSTAEVTQILDTVVKTGNDRLMVGFNRRFAPLFVELRSRFGTPSHSSLVRYTVNAGRLAPGSWYCDAENEGSRFEGEGGHFIDTLSWWLAALPTEVTAMSTKDPENLQVLIRFDDASLATMTYATNGHNRFPKETFEAFGGMRAARLDNFRRGTVWRGRRRRTQRVLGAVDKGQGAELAAFLGAVGAGGPMPISIASLVATTRATLAVSRSLASGTSELL